MIASRLRELDQQMTAGPWRKRPDRSYPDLPVERWQIAAGKEEWFDNKGDFHPDHARYVVDDEHPVAFGYDRDYHFAEGGIEHEPDADGLVALRNALSALANVIEIAEDVKPPHWRVDPNALGAVLAELAEALA